MASLTNTLIPLACAAWFATLCPASGQEDRFVEIPNGEIDTTTFDLRTVQMIQPGKFTIISTKIDYPDVMEFELKVLRSLRPYCARPAGKYPASAELMMLGPPDMPVKSIEVTSSQSELAGKMYPFKVVLWFYPYRRLAWNVESGEQHPGFLQCQQWGKGEDAHFQEMVALITNGLRSKRLFDCKRGLSGFSFGESYDPSRTATLPVPPGSELEWEYYRVCYAVTHEAPYLPKRLGEQKSAASPPMTVEPKSPPANLGTGFFIGEHGTILTNAHVVEGCSEVSVGPRKLLFHPTPEQMANAKAKGYSDAEIEASLNEPIKASVVNRDEKNDLALLHADFEPKVVAVLRPSIRQGETVVTYGFPLPGLLASGGNLTTGNITALSGLGDDSRLLQISAPVQPGNSGGPLLDSSGSVVGIVVGKLNAIKIAKAVGDVPQNVNFAIKASVAATFLEANGIHYTTAQPGVTRSPADIAEEAKRFTVPVECRGKTP
jgi:S1-C subfamily serine protease